MGTDDGGQVTGTADREGDAELADFFRRAQDASRRGGEEGKKLLASRVTAGR